MTAPDVVWIDEYGVATTDPSDPDHGGDYAWTRYVRADEGDVVIPAAVAKRFRFYARRSSLASHDAVRPIIDAIREQQGGAS